MCVVIQGLYYYICHAFLINGESNKNISSNVILIIIVVCTVFEKLLPHFQLCEI